MDCNPVAAIRNCIALCLLTGIALAPNAAARRGPHCSLDVSAGSGTVPLTITANGSCTEVDGNIVSVTISWGDGSPVVGVNGNRIQETHTYTQPGSFNVVLTGTDDGGRHGSASQSVSVTQPPNSPSCSVSISNSNGVAPLTVSAVARCSDPGNDISSVLVDFGDGFYLGGSGGTHTYSSPGTFTVTAIATNRAGNVSPPASQSVNVAGDPLVYLGISSGEIASFDNQGNRQTILNTGLGGSMTGMGFDAVGNLYTTDFTADMVSKFAGNSPATFGSQYNCKPESIVFDPAGNAYVGEAGCSHALLKFDAYGNLITSFQVATEDTGSDWIDLAPDQCTLLYTSEGPSVLRYNVCAKEQLPALTSALQKGLALRILPDGGVVVADVHDIKRFDSAGRNIMTYDAAGEDCWSALTLDHGGNSFWAADYCTSDVLEFDVNSGNVLFKFNTGTPTSTVFGVGVRSSAPSPVAAGPLVASSGQASIAGGQSASYSLTFSPAGAASGQNFTFSCANLPSGASCSFSPASLTASGGTLATSLTISTRGASAHLVPFGRPSTLALAVSAFPFLFFLSSDYPRKRRGWRKFAMLALVLLTAALLSCAGGSSSTSTSSGGSPSSPAPTGSGSAPSGTYAVVVRATAANLQSSTSVQLTVQ